MALDQTDVENTAHLARIAIDQQDIANTTEGLTQILTMIDQMQAADTNNIEPLAHPLEMEQRLRPDAVTEENQRAAFQSIAPATENGLYLVPKVIE